MSKLRKNILALFVCALIIIFSFTVFGIVQKIEEPRKYSRGSNYHTSLEYFEKDVYSKLKTELLWDFKTENLIVVLTDETNIKNDLYSFYLEGETFKSYVYFTVYSDSCLFTIETNFFAEELYDDVMSLIGKYDSLITKFGLKYFYDLWDTNSMFLDVYDGKDGGYKIVHSDSLYGDIGIIYNKRTDVDMIEKYGLFNLKIRFLLTNC